MRTPTILALILALTLTFAGCTDQTQETGGTAMDTTQMQSDTAMTSTQPAMQAAMVKVSQQGSYGKHLVDGEGMSLYLFEKDSQGENASTCYDACAKAWPPLLTSGSPTAGGSAVDSSMFGTIKRRDGEQQVTYNGHPLYHFTKDQRMGDANGQDVEGFGGEWYLVSPAGTEVEED